MLNSIFLGCIVLGDAAVLVALDGRGRCWLACADAVTEIRISLGEHENRLVGCGGAPRATTQHVAV